MIRKKCPTNPNLNPIASQNETPNPKKSYPRQWLKNMSKKEGTGTFGPGGSRPYHTKGGDCLGISPPSQKGKERKEAHEAGHMQDLKPKHVKRKFKKTPNMMPNNLQK